MIKQLLKPIKHQLLKSITVVNITIKECHKAGSASLVQVVLIFRNVDSL